MADDIQYLVGDEISSIKPLEPYDETVVAFLNEFSSALMKDAQCKMFPDIITFAFWARKANIARLKRDYPMQGVRLGRGLAFHIAPSNIPINFIFTYAFGLLAGNANVVRVSSKEFPQVDQVCRVLNALLSEPRNKPIADRTAIVRYPRQSDHTKIFSSACHARIIWGGDQTIETIRRNPIAPRTIDIAFADRYSLVVIAGDELIDADENAFSRLMTNFYNDTYLMDQNACSSPQLILWTGNRIDEAKARFWQGVFDYAKHRYDLSPIKVVDKYLQACLNAIDFDEIDRVQRHGNLVWRVSLKTLNPLTNDRIRGKFGLFFEYDLNDWAELWKVVNEKYQTLTYFGVDAQQIAELVRDNGLLGIDRIVPIGKALDINIFWDGFNLIEALSRNIFFE